MTNDDKSPYSFTIRRVPDSERQKQARPDRKEGPSVQEPEQQAPDLSGASKKNKRIKKTKKPRSRKKGAKAVTADMTPAAGGCFDTSARVLSFVSAIAGSNLTNEALCRYSSEGGWWAEVELPADEVVHIIRTAGGRPFARQNGQWAAVSLSGLTTESRLETLDLSGWQQVELSDLLADTALRPRQLVTSPELHVVAPPSLSRWILRRAASLGIQVGIVSAMRRPLHREAQESGVLLLRLRMEKGGIPLSLVRAMTSLPYTTVARPIGLAADRLLVDVNYRAPLSEALLSSMIPEQETWLLGAPEIGHWRLLLQGSETDGAILLEPPAVEAIELPAEETPELPAPIPISVVGCGRSSGRVDAVLLDDLELDWTRLFMAGRPAGETAFILPGPGKHLLAAPGGLPGLLPFGVPLTHLKPGGLFLETGLDFYPALPETARKQAFQLKEGVVVAVTEEKAYRFSQKNLLPAWTLWTGQTPETEDGVSEKAMEILDSIDSNLRAKELREAKSSPPWTDKAKDMLKIRHPEGQRKTDRGQLLEEAQRAEWSGDFVQAAEIMEALGDMAQAGRLYEKAASRITA
ncbi:MAG: hypothetical protein GY862_02505 [Gammaproteobacteria bacterium]|nr:hypothetical protein [Gammaproteobacteria bacterium]